MGKINAVLALHRVNDKNHWPVSSVSSCTSVTCFIMNIDWVSLDHYKNTYLTLTEFPFLSVLTIKGSCFQWRFGHYAQDEKFMVVYGSLPVTVDLNNRWACRR